jgi:hypothetical protein
MEGAHRKKRFTSFPSPAGMSLTKLPLGRNNSVMTSLFPPRESLVVTHHGRRKFKDTNPLMSSSLVILFGAVKQFCRFRIWSETEFKTPAEYGPQYISTPPPPTVTFCLYILYNGKVGEGGGGQKEGTVEGQHSTVHKYSSSPIHEGQQITSWVKNTNHK